MCSSVNFFFNCRSQNGGLVGQVSNTIGFATLTARDFFLAYFYPSNPFTYILPKPLPISPVLAVAST